MTKFTQEEYSKAANGTLSHTEWNKAATNINELIDASGNAGGGSVSSAIAANLELTGGDGNNMTIKSAKHLNLEPSYKTYDSQNQTWSSDNEGDLQLKPGDDITLYSHHRSADKRDEVSLKVLDGNDKPVKLQIQAGEITLQAKQKNLTKKKDTTTGEDSTGTADTDYIYKDDQANVFDINVTTEYKPNRGSGSKKSGKGYLKVRAQAIDLRCEQPGGIAIQPKGKDGEDHENKIKFEHGGGDGLEFGTFNSEKTSIYTGEYRFKKMGLIKLATRNKIASDKYDGSDSTTRYKYEKNTDDDFYDFVDANDPRCTWKDILSYVAWAKSHQEGPFDITYLLNDQIDDKRRYIVFDSSYAPSAIQDLIDGIANIKIMYKPEGQNVDPTEVTLYVNTITGAGLSGQDNGTYYYDLHFQSTSDESDPTRIMKDVAVEFRVDGTVWIDRIITPNVVNGVTSDSINDAIEYITSIAYTTPNA